MEHFKVVSMRTIGNSQVAKRKQRMESIKNYQNEEEKRQ